MGSKFISSAAKEIAKKRRMAVSDEATDDSNIVEQQEKSRFSDDTGLGGSDALIAALQEQLDQVPSYEEATKEKSIPQENYGSSPIAEAAKSALAEKKKKRSYK